VVEIDVARAHMGYFHNQGYYHVGGEDFLNALRIRVENPAMLPPYVARGDSLLARVTGVDRLGLPVLVLSIIVIVVACEHVIPLFIVRSNPERVLDVLLPSFDALAKVLRPLTIGLLSLDSTRRKQLSGVRHANGNGKNEMRLGEGRPCRPGRHRGQEGQARAAPHAGRLPRNDGARS
jgi:hypothetical protein